MDHSEEMAASLSDCDVQANGCKTLAEAELDDFNNALPAVVAALKAHPASVDVQREGCKALCAIASAGHKQTQSLLDAGILPTLLTAMSVEDEDGSVQVQACRVFAQLAAISEEAKLQLIHNQVLPAIVAAATAFRNTPEHDVHDQALACLDEFVVRRERPSITIKAAMAALRAWPEHAGVQRHFCQQLWCATVRDTSDIASKQQVVDEDGLPLIVNIMTVHASDAGVLLHSMTALWSVSAATEQLKRALLNCGCLGAALHAMSCHLRNRQLQQAGCAMLSKMAGTPQDFQLRLLEVNAMSAILEAMRTHPGHGGIWEWSCRALGALSSISMEPRARLLASVEAIEFMSKALSLDSLPRGARIGAVSFLRSMAELQPMRPVLIEKDSHKALVSAGLSHVELFGLASAALSYVDPDHLDEMHLDMVPDPTEYRMFLAAADSQRFKTKDVVKDVLIPLVDVYMDIVNLVDFCMKQWWHWASILAASLVFNSVASAALAMGQKRPAQALLNLCSAGTGGQVWHAVESWQDTAKSKMLLGQKVVEGFESIVSLLITSDAIAVAGSDPDVPELNFHSAALKWGSIQLSVACLSLLGVDLDRHAIYENEDLAHLRWLVTGSNSSILLAFHASEVLAALVIIPMTSATRPFGIVVFACMTIFLALLVFLRESAQWDGDWVIVTDDFGKNMRVQTRGTHLFVDGRDYLIQAQGGTGQVTTDASTFSVTLLSAGDIMVWGSGSYSFGSSAGGGWPWAEGRVLCRKETLQFYKAGLQGFGCLSGLARRTLTFLLFGPTCLMVNVLTYLPGPCMQKLALLRSLLFFVAWVIVGLQTLRASTVREDLSSHHVLVLMGLAAAGFVANVALLAHQWRCGRFDHASLFPSPTFLSRYIEMSQNDTEVREMLQERV